jgi:hypothetical protein
MQQSAEYGEVQDAVQVVDWKKTREMAVAAAEVWSTKMPYDDWVKTYNTNFKHAGSLAAAGMLLDPLGARQGLLGTQFTCCTCCTCTKVQILTPLGGYG